MTYTNVIFIMMWLNMLIRHFEDTILNQMTIINMTKNVANGFRTFPNINNGIKGPSYMIHIEIVVLVIYWNFVVLQDDKNLCILKVIIWANIIHKA